MAVDASNFQFKLQLRKDNEPSTVEIQGKNIAVISEHETY